MTVMARNNGRGFIVATSAVVAVVAFFMVGPASAAPPNLGPNVIVFSSSMPQATI